MGRNKTRLRLINVIVEGAKGKSPVPGYLWDGGGVGDGGHDLVDQLLGDVSNHSLPLGVLVGEGLRRLTLLSNYTENKTDTTFFSFLEI